MRKNTTEADSKLPDEGGGGTPHASTGGPGAPPSITAPANCIRPLRHGVDSLYLSFQGEVDQKLAVELQECKTLAQASNEEVIALAHIAVGDHTFAVMPRGRGRFAFVMEDNWFSIQLSNVRASGMPLALVQVRSQYLTAVGPEEAIRVITQLVGCMGKVIGPPKLSRLDLYVDFTTSLDPSAIPGPHWVKRSKKRTIHEECNKVTGISFGSGNEVSARLYDKTRELAKSGKFYMEPLWKAAGWEPGQTVWRMEFQIRREGLPEAMHGAADYALRSSGNLWRYLCEEWLRLAIPNPTDETRSRWPTHPLWAALSLVWDVDPSLPLLTRVPKTRAPSDDFIFRTGLAGLTSFMGREGITDFGEGLGEFLQGLEAYFDEHGGPNGETIQQYVKRKARFKARRYNVRMPRHDKE